MELEPLLLHDETQHRVSILPEGSLGLRSLPEEAVLAYVLLQHMQAAAASSSGRPPGRWRCNGALLRWPEKAADWRRRPGQNQAPGDPSHPATSAENACPSAQLSLEVAREAM